jgi:hypothetical protein
MKSGLVKMRIISTGLFFCTLFSLSCEKEVSRETASNTQPDVDVDVDENVDVYVLGVERDSINAIGKYKYWKNGTEITLASTRPSYLQSICVSGNDVYVAGYEMADNGNGIVTYWKNGTPVYVTDGSFDAIAFAITVSGNDVYIAGTEGRFQDGCYYIFPTYWKNGNAVNLTSGSPDGGAFDIAISGNDVYTAGAVSNGYGTVATFWKNGDPVQLSTPFDAVLANSIAVADGNVYVAGTQYLSDHTTGKLWKNGIDMHLADDLNLSADYVAVSNNDVYVSTSGDQIAKYYKNGSAVALDLPGSIASSIAVNGKDVYVAGTKTNGTHNVATYWKNGSPVSLSDGTKDNYGVDIFLSAH